MAMASLRGAIVTVTRKATTITSYYEATFRAILPLSKRARICWGLLGLGRDAPLHENKASWCVEVLMSIRSWWQVSPTVAIHR